MAWNPAPDVAHLRDFGEKFDRPVVVTFALFRDGTQFQITTYGETKKLCKLASVFGDRIAALVSDGTIAAPQIEPHDEEVVGNQIWIRKDTQ